MSNKLLVQLNNISLSFNNQRILEDISFTVAEGEIITIIGPNGSGKTTLAKILLGLIKPDYGSRTIAANIVCSYMPQKIKINEQLPLTVCRFLSLTKASKQHILTLSEEIGIAHLLDKQIHYISGGELQKVLLTRSLLFNPQLMVLDEPIQGVDINGQAEFYQLIAKIRDQRNIAIVMISHDLYMVMKSTEKVLCLNRHICCQGTPEDISKHPYYMDAFNKDALSTLALYSHQHDHVHHGHTQHKHD
jgi:zinc transport system ATP-binding protein